METEHNVYTDYLKKFAPFGYTPKYDSFKIEALKRPYKIIIGGVYKIQSGKTVWFIDYQENFRLVRDKYVVLNQKDYTDSIGFGYFINEHGTKVGGEIDFGIRDLEYCFDTVDEYIESEFKKGMPIIGFKKEGGEVCI